MHYIMPDLKTKPPLALCFELAGSWGRFPCKCKSQFVFRELVFPSFFFSFKLLLNVIVLCFLLHASTTPAQLLPSCLPSPLGPVDLASSFVGEAPSPVPPDPAPTRESRRARTCVFVCLRPPRNTDASVQLPCSLSSRLSQTCAGAGPYPNTKN